MVLFRKRLKFTTILLKATCFIFIGWGILKWRKPEDKVKEEKIEHHLRKINEAKGQTDQQAKVNDITFSDVETRNKERLSRIHSVCERGDTPLLRRKNATLRALMDPNRQITYCRVNKVASTYTIQTLTQTFNCSLTCLQRTSNKVRSLEYSHQRDVIARTFKFMFVREPYGRLFSTYSNRFYFTKEHWAPVGREIIRKCREKPTFESKKYGHDVTFHEMIRYVVEKFEAGRVNIDDHLRPMYLHCEPCDYSYDFIGHLETMESDWTYLKEFWTTRRKIAELPNEIGKDTREGIPEWIHVKNTIGMFKNTSLSQYKLYLRAWSYYQITGRVYKYISMPFTEDSAINIDSFKEALSKAVEQSKSHANECKKQKQEALLQAYVSVPLELLERLKNVLKADCHLFGYENRPDWVFKRENIKSDFNYFKGLV